MPPKKKAANGYKFAEPLPKGIILEDIGKKKWSLGVSIGKGGFGEIYSAQEEGAKGNKYPYVVKIEPHENGPLFVEVNFYIRNAKLADIESFKRNNGLKMLGMPVYYGSGSLEYKDEKYRFLVMDKFGSDLHKLYLENGKEFPTDTVFKLGIQIMDVLKYMHEKGYVHADIKAANLLMGLSKETQNKQVYLVDFGLATKYNLDKEFKPNPKKAHDGTIEYLSRDAHQGVQTRRGDLEILAYNMIHWLGCKLPWEDNLKDPKKVQNSKEESMSTVDKMVKSCFGSKSAPKGIVNFLKYLKTLKFDTEPDYEKIKKIFTEGIKEASGTLTSPLQFSLKKTPLRKVKTPVPNSRSNKTKEKVTKHTEESTPKAAKTGKPKDLVTVIQDDSDNEEGDYQSDSDTTVVLKPKTKLKKENIKTKNMRAKKIEVNNSDHESDSEQEEPPPKKQRQGKKDDIPEKKRNLRARKIEVNDSDRDSDSEQEPPVKKPVVAKKTTTKSKKAKKNDTEMIHSDSENVTVRKKVNTNRNQATNLKKGQAMSLNDINSAVGLTDAMKEVMRKRLNKAPKKKGKNNDDLNGKAITEADELLGYNDEMREIASKKKTNQAASTSRSKRKIIKSPIANGVIIEGSDSE